MKKIIIVVELKYSILNIHCFLWFFPLVRSGKQPFAFAQSIFGLSGKAYEIAGKFTINIVCRRVLIKQDMYLYYETFNLLNSYPPQSPVPQLSCDVINQLISCFC